MSFNAMSNAQSNRVIDGGDFWPDVSVGEFQQLYRIPQEYAEDLVENHLSLAAVWAQRQLHSWATTQRLEGGYVKLADIPLACGLKGESERLYLRAVFCHAKALLLGQFATIERREAAKNEAKESEPIQAMFYAWAQDAINDLQGNGRAIVALI